MTPLTAMIAAFVLGVPVLAFAWAGGAVLVAAPLTLLWILLLGALDVRRRRTQSESMGHRRQKARAQSVEFTERDKETLTSE